MAYRRPILPIEEIQIEFTNGDEEVVQENRVSITELLRMIKNKNIPESEYDNIKLFINDEINRDFPFLECVYYRNKTKEEMEKEFQEEEARVADIEKKKQKNKAEREAKKAEKEKVLASLTEEQKKALGIKK